MAMWSEDQPASTARATILASLSRLVTLRSGSACEFQQVGECEFARP
jgi:hypothetical protein